ncbi:MAG: hypothetical protein IPF67_03720 [Saprospiraceae bacterium]|nr:hypothetical protein [Candidatus Brachybacter algidus]
MSNKIKVAILSGGDSEERVVSEKSASVVLKYLPEDKYDARIIDILGAKWTDLITGVAIDKNDFSFNLHDEPWKADVVFLCYSRSTHGKWRNSGLFRYFGHPLYLL